MKASYGQVVLVDNGYFFPEDDLHKDVSWFLMDAMKVLGTDAVGMSEKELRFGVGYLKAQVKRTQLPMVCANLYEKKTKKLLLQPYVLKQVGTVKVGIFGLMSNTVDLGPMKDSLTVEEPSAAAKRMVAELRKKGATVVVLLSQLGKVESEDLVTAVEGVDAIMVGHNVPLLQKGRTIKNTVACYGGEQGQYIGRTVITLDPQRRKATADNETFILSAEVGERKEIAALVKGFEDSFNEKLQKAEKERAAKEQAKATSPSPDHYLGAEVCIRCHAQEGEQWKTTRHARAWQTLVDGKKDATPECVGCHVVGYKQPGGFVSVTATPTLTNVQCESCHGMGTQHEALTASPRRITAETCRQCHTATNSPTFDFALYQPHVAHKYAGTPPPLPEGHGTSMQRAAGGK
ncbi:MAG: hypothetical protein HZC42_05380 [Candidatus Eisenbacteria bacterium]|nr:hypothetical protein [Candidatus Eisenbacteria bacterium]